MSDRLATPVMNQFSLLGWCYYRMNEKIPALPSPCREAEISTLEKEKM